MFSSPWFDHAGSCAATSLSTRPQSGPHNSSASSWRSIIRTATSSHDRDAIFSSGLDTALKDFGVRVLKTPVRAPKAKAFKKDGLWHVVDFKTDTYVPSRNAQYQRQLRWYAFALSQLTHEVVNCHLLAIFEWGVQTVIAVPARSPVPRGKRLLPMGAPLPSSPARTEG